jgi:hypothetical protein
MERARKPTPEQTKGLLRQIDLGTANGETAACELWFAYDCKSTRPARPTEGPLGVVDNDFAPGLLLSRF